MATDILNDMFLRSTRLDDSQDPWLDSVVRRELAELAVSVPQWGDTGCSLANIGEFLVRSTTVLSHLANCVVYGEHIDTYTSRKIQEIEEETDFSELTFLEYLDDKHQSLKSIAARLQATAEQTDHSWKASIKPPPASHLRTHRRQHRPRRVSYSSVGPMDQAEGSVYSPNITSGGGGYKSIYTNDQVQPDAQSPRSDRSAQSSTNDPYASLSSRGKGHHVCPRGTSCSKGGVGPGGDIIVFERNSAFRAHMQKHEKKYKCDIPGCTNREGFARKDHLQRHKESVAHK